MAANRYITTSGDLALIPGSSLGDYILFLPAGNAYGWYINQSNGAFKIYNFSVGVNSVGFAEHAANSYSQSPAWLNHYSNGELKSQGTGSGSYTGPIGNRIWLLGGYTMGSCNMNGMDIHGSAGNRVIITNVNGKFRFLKTDSSILSGYTFVLWGGATYFRMTGQYDPVKHTGDINFQGHKGGYMFSQDKYGIELDYLDYNDEQPCLYLTFNANYIEIDHIRINADGGFSCISAKTDHTPALDTMYLTIHDCLLYYSKSEGMYIGNTTISNPAGPQAEHRSGFLAYNNRIFAVGTEAIQVDQCAPGTVVEHNVCLCSSMSHMNPFQGNQLGGNQMVTRVGDVKSVKNIFHGACLDHLVQHDTSTDDTNDVTKPVYLNNVWFGTRSKLCHYFNGTNNTAITILYSGYIGDLQNDLSRSATFQNTNAIFLAQEGATPFVCNNLTIDVGITTAIAIGGLPATRNHPQVIRNQVVPEPQYVRSGIEGKSWSDLVRWSAAYGTGGPVAGNPVQWKVTDWVLDKNLWYASKSAHTNQNPPAGNATYWDQLFWDSNGWHSKHVNYNGVPSYTYPPLDLRLKASDFYNKNGGYGLYDNEELTDRTTIKVEYGYGPTGFFPLLLPMERKLDTPVSEVTARIGPGYYTRRTIKLVKSNGQPRVSTSEWEPTT